MIDIQVVFKGSIKPSVPTPDHLRHYQLSFLDQIKPSYFMPMILFYSQEAQTNILTKEQRSDTIKKSLSEALTPLLSARWTCKTFFGKFRFPIMIDDHFSFLAIINSNKVKHCKQVIFWFIILIKLF